MNDVFPPPWDGRRKCCVVWGTAEPLSCPVIRCALAQVDERVTVPHFWSMAKSAFRMGSGASAILALFVAISSMVTAEVLSDQSRAVRLLVAAALGTLIGAVVFRVAKRLSRQT